MENKDIKGRAELHLHTKLSDAPAVISVSEIFEKATQFGLDTVAFTNMNNVLDFPEIIEKSKKYPDIKVIYGAEVHYKTDDPKINYGVTLLARNQAGIKELYKVISSVKKDGSYSFVDLEVLKNNRKNLLVGSFGRNGELYDAVMDGNGEQIAGLYDYFEIFPAEYGREKTVYTKIYALGEKLGIPTVAACNARYLSPEDAVCCDIITSDSYHFLIEKLFNKRTYVECGRYLRTTDEMLSEFSYLGSKNAEKVVFDNPSEIASLIEKAEPLPQTAFCPYIENSKDQLAELCFKRASELYGLPLPDTVDQRLQKELAFIKDDRIASAFLIVKKLSDSLRHKGAFSALRGLGSTAFISYLSGVSEVNSLPAHYYCSHCHYFEEHNEMGEGVILKGKPCPICAKPLNRDGHNIPAESFFGLKGEKEPALSICFPDSYSSKAAEWLKNIAGDGNVVHAGIIRTRFEKCADEIISRFESEHDFAFDGNVRKDILNKIIGTKRYDCCHPVGFMIKPDSLEFEDFTPVMSVPSSPDDGQTHFDYSVLRDYFLRLDVLPLKQLEMLLKLQDKTGVRLEDIKLDDYKIYELLQSSAIKNLPDFECEIVVRMYNTVKPKNFAELVKMQGLSHGTNVWTDNGEYLLTAGISILDLPTTREDIFNDLLKCTDRETAYKYTEGIRKGYFANGKFSDEEIKEFKEITKPLAEWYFDFCSKIIYMFPKAHAVEYAIVYARLAWFKAYYPELFEAVASEVDNF